GQLDGPNTLAAATLAVEVFQLRALAVPGIRHDQDGRVVPTRVQRHDFVAGAHLHATDTGGGAPHGTHVVLTEADPLSQLRHHQDVIAAVRGDHLHELVTVAKVQRDDAAAQR